MVLRQQLAIFAATLYLSGLVWLYLSIPFGDPGYEYGGIRLWLFTLPWSLVGPLIPMLLSPHLPDPTPAWLGDFVSFSTVVLLCGGLNSFIIMRLGGVRVGVTHLRLIGPAAAILTVGICVTADWRAALALEHHRPANVPKSAFQQPTVAGWYWQTCQLDARANQIMCQIWNRGGDVLRSEEFVPQDDGPAVKSEELHFTDRGDSSRIALKNGRVLIPKSRKDKQGATTTH